MLKFDLSRLENLRSKLFKIKINIGMTIKPENDIALVKETTSCKIRVSLGNSTWKKIKKNKEVRIANVIFAIKSLNEVLINLNEFKNSIGKNNKNRAAKNINRLQNKLCPDHVVINLSEKFADSKNR